MKILGEGEETIELLEEFARRDSGVSLGHFEATVAQHAAHGFNGCTVFKRNQRSECVSPDVCR